jgi:hypothetical protein
MVKLLLAHVLQDSKSKAFYIDLSDGVEQKVGAKSETCPA